MRAADTCPSASATPITASSASTVAAAAATHTNVAAAHAATSNEPRDERTFDIAGLDVGTQRLGEEPPWIELPQQQVDALARADGRVGRRGEVVPEGRQVARACARTDRSPAASRAARAPRRRRAPVPQWTRAIRPRAGAGSRGTRRSRPRTARGPRPVRDRRCASASRTIPRTRPTGIIARSSRSTDHTASRNTNHHSTAGTGSRAASATTARSPRISKREDERDAEHRARCRRAGARSTARGRSRSCRARPSRLRSPTPTRRTVGRRARARRS